MYTVWVWNDLADDFVQEPQSQYASWNMASAVAADRVYLDGKRRKVVYKAARRKKNG